MTIEVQDDSVKIVVKTPVTQLIVQNTITQLTIAKGPQGPIGPTGATGATGAKGDKGDKGDQGDPGTPAVYSDATPQPLGTAAAGVLAAASRADHVHQLPTAAAVPYVLLDLQTGNTSPSRTHNSAAFAAAINAYGTFNVCDIVVPPGEWYLASKVTIDRPVTIRGAGLWFANGSNLWFPVGSIGFEIDYNGSGPIAGGRGSLLERLRIGPAAGGGVFNANTPGIAINARCTLRDLDVTSMAGHGIAVVASTGDIPSTEANLVRMDNVRTDANLGHGFFFDGADVNACLLTACDASSNAMDGFSDSSFLGVYLIGCHAAANGGRSYDLGIDPNADSQAVACYVEGGQGPVRIQNKALWLGPFPAGGFSADSNAPYVTASRANSISFENASGGNTVQFRAGRINSQVGFELSSQGDGYNPWQMIYGNVAGAAVSGAWSLLYRGTDSVMAFTDDTLTTAGDRRQMWLPKGAHFGSAMGDKITGTGAGSPAAIGTATAGSATTVSRSDHSHALSDVFRPLGSAYRQVTAHSRGGQNNATLVGLQITLITAASDDGDSVRLLDSSDAPMIGGGARGEIWNRTVYDIDVFPPSGSKIFLGVTDLGTDNAVAVSSGQRIVWLCDDDNNYNIG